MNPANNYGNNLLGKRIKSWISDFDYILEHWLLQLAVNCDRIGHMKCCLAMQACVYLRNVVW